MKLKVGLLVSAVAAAALVLTSNLAVAEERQGERREGGREGGNHEAGRENEGNRGQHRGQRSAPPKYQPHPAGAHPHGPIVRGHPVRVLQPRVYTNTEHNYRHWEHPEFARPTYYWQWNAIRSVSCTAEDSYGDQYPVSQVTTPGFGLENMTAVEDEALDRCNQESGGDPNCYLVSCSHF